MGRSKPFGASSTIRELFRAAAVFPTHRLIPEGNMGRYALLWLLGVPIPILLLIYLFGGLH
jgi:hypothetical protein